MTLARFHTHREAREVEWHSRRHETRDQQDAARVKYQGERGKSARQRRAQERE